jgi:hypothetical protein
MNVLVPKSDGFHVLCEIKLSPLGLTVDMSLMKIYRSFLCRQCTDSLRLQNFSNSNINTGILKYCDANIVLEFIGGKKHSFCTVIKLLVLNFISAVSEDVVIVCSLHK